MNADIDKIHLILYFINNQEETLIYEMEKKIIETLKREELFAAQTPQCYRAEVLKKALKRP